MKSIFFIIFILGIVLFLFGLYELNVAKKIRINKDDILHKKEREQQRLQDNIDNLSNRRTELLEAIEYEKQKYDEICENEKNKISEQLNLYKQNARYASEEYSSLLEDKYRTIEEEFDNKIKCLNDEKENAKNSLQSLKDALSAGVQAQLREREKQEKENFYRLTICRAQLEDVMKLNSLKPGLHQPVILSKLIWTQYFQKQTTELCNRVLGTEKVCGIYKITNLVTKQCYIGQSVDVAQRWKDHVKCGLGIDASATNKLYNAMQRDGVWNFTFELMEKCPREQLNEKEKLWINLYQTNLYGFNLTKGNK